MQSLKGQEVKKPAEIFGLYFDTFVRYDNEEVAKLNEYLRPIVEGKEIGRAHV